MTSPGRRVTRRLKRHEDHPAHEAWAIPFGDLLTLLLAFFVVMYALSSVNEGKYRVLSDSLYTAFRGAPRSLEPVQVGKEHPNTGSDNRAGVAPQAGGSLRPVADEVTGPVPLPDKQRPDASMAHVADQVESALSDLIRKDVVSVRRSDRWVEVEIRTDLLFPSGSAQLAPSAATIIEQLGQVLGPLPNAVRVEGHTDNVPIRNTAFYSNWELSAARAGSVVRVLSSHGVDPNRLAVVGFGEQRPKESNDSAQGRNANRRVVVVIPALDAEHPRDPLRNMHPLAPPAVPGETAAAPPAEDTQANIRPAAAN